MKILLLIECDGVQCFFTKFMFALYDFMTRTNVFDILSQSHRIQEPGDDHDLLRALPTWMTLRLDGLHYWPLGLCDRSAAILSFLEDACYWVTLILYVYRASCYTT